MLRGLPVELAFQVGQVFVDFGPQDAVEGLGTGQTKGLARAPKKQFRVLTKERLAPQFEADLAAGDIAQAWNAADGATGHQEGHIRGRHARKAGIGQPLVDGCRRGSVQLEERDVVDGGEPRQLRPVLADSQLELESRRLL